MKTCGQLRERTTWVFVVIALLGAMPTSSTARDIGFTTGTVLEIDGRVIKFLGGATWVMESQILALPLDEAVIVFADLVDIPKEPTAEQLVRLLPDVGILFYQGQSVAAQRVSGIYHYERGRFANVVAEHADGAVLKLDDGTYWDVPSYDRYDTGYWLPPYPVVISASELFMYNLEKGKRIWVSPAH